MARKGSRKSHLGCFECKRRHIKCDESRPICLQCSRAERECRYGLGITKRSNSGRVLVLDIAPAPAVSTMEDEAGLQGTSHSRREGGTSASLAVVPVGSAHQVTRQSSLPTHNSVSTNVTHTLRPPFELSGGWRLNMVQLELLHNYQSVASIPFGINDSQVRIYCNLAIARGIAFPPLMCQILAMSAAELSLRRPERQRLYQNGAVTLQLAAIAGFNKIMSQIDEDNCVDVFLFQELNSIHNFCDTFSSEESFEVFSSRLVGTIRLFQGMPALVVRWWTSLCQTDMRMHFQHPELQNMVLSRSRGECDSLIALIDRADSSDSSVAVCREVIQLLQSQFDRVNALGQTRAGTKEAIIWLITLHNDFVELIEQQMPEAMVILAYFAVLLDRCQTFWFMAGAPKRLLKHINGHLTKEWETWLAWPNAMIFGSSI